MLQVYSTELPGKKSKNKSPRGILYTVQSRDREYNTTFPLATNGQYYIQSERGGGSGGGEANLPFVRGKKSAKKD